ncbi:MAG: prohibitin family protein [Clostridiales bacterium]|jgi:regulator of protease activity HflC (stomatin/prohibitin superfamily)|nr:prohibitin family protein [Clostridiales bacterium]
MERRRVWLLAVLPIIAVAVIVVLFMSFAIVPAGYSGVRSRLGAVDNTPLAEGLHVKTPFVDNIINMDNRVQRADIDAAAVSSDLQMIDSTVSVNYRIIKSESANVYKNIGGDITETIVTPAVQECVKAVTAKFTAEELVINRQTVSEQMRELLEAKIRPYGVSVEIFNVVNFNFSAEFNAAIEAKQTAQQNALKAEQELARVRIDAQQKVEQAKAEADAIRAKADADAYAIEKVQQQLSKEPQYIEYMKIEKWDGRLPYVSGDGLNPIIDLRGLPGAEPESE